MKFIEEILMHPKVRSTAFLLVFVATIVTKNILRKAVDSVLSALEQLS